MKLSFAEVFETATFYAHFDVVKEGEANIPPLTIRVCDSLACAMLGGEKLLQELQNKAGPGIRVVRAPCVGLCDAAPVAEVGHHFVMQATAAERAGDGRAAARPQPDIPPYVDYDAYVAGGGYKLLERSALRRASARNTCSKALDDSQLARARRRRIPDGPQMARGAAASPGRG